MAAVQAIAQFFWGILLTLDSIVYFLISWLYQIILLLCRIDILGNGTEISELVGRVYTIIGVVILFLVAYSLLRAMVNPDDLKGKKSPTNIVKNVLISIALVALTPTIFSFALDFQNALLEQNTIGKLVLGDRTDGESSATTIEKGGNRMAATVLQSFLHPNYSQCTIVTSDDGSVGYDCPEIATGGLNFLLFEVANEHTTYDAVWDEVENNGNFLNITTFAYALAHESTMTYYPIISTIAGAFVFLVLLSYCIDIAIRTIKLAVFELIAPLPILARIMPGDQGSKVFNNWVKACISTYAEVFIRLAILFFAVLIIKIVIQNIPTIFLDLGLLNGDVGITVFLFTQAFLVIGIILFVKQAPQILKDITGLDSGKYNVFGSAFKSMSMLGGGVTAAVRNWNDTDNLKGKNRVTRTMDRLRRAAAGAGSGVARSTMNRDNVKDVRSMRANARDSANRAFQAHQERIAYAKSHPGTLGPLSGHIKDTKDKINYWAHGNVDDKRLQAIVDLAGKVGKGANDSVESLMAMIHGGAKEQKRQLDAMKNRTVEVTDYFDSIVDVDDKGNQVVKYVEKGANLNDPSVRAKAIDASAARQVAQEANAKLYKDAKDKFEETYSQAIASLYTTNLNDPSSNISAAREAWGIKSSVSDADARRQLEGFRNQITNRLNTIALDQTVAKETDASFNNLKSLNVENIVEQLAQAEAKTLEKNHISYNIADLRKKYSTDTNAIEKQIMSNISTNKAVAGEIQREVEYQAAEAKVRNARLNNDKKKD